MEKQFASFQIGVFLLLCVATMETHFNFCYKEKGNA